MKHVIFLLCLMLADELTIAQPTLCITTDKTSSLVFPYPILHVDRGSRMVLVQPVKDAPHVLLIKAGAKNFTETNLSVITEDGSVYSFLVCFTDRPDSWVYELPAKKETSIANYASSILDNRKTIRGIVDRKWNIRAAINGIYIHSGVLFFHLQLVNQSPIDYEVDLSRFFIRDKRKAKRTAVQENDLQSVYVTGNITKVNAFSTATAVVALNKFTIPDAKQMWVQIMEKNGGRHLQLKITNNDLMHAIILPDLK
jgi:conjugative transposon TraN protein